MELNKKSQKQTHTYVVGQFSTKAPEYSWRRDNLLKKWCWENWTDLHKKMKLDHYVIPFTKINSKWIKDLNVRPENIKLLEENIGSKPLDVNLGNNCLSLTPKVKATKAKINKWEHIKLRDFLKTKKIINKMKRQPTE